MKLLFIDIEPNAQDFPVELAWKLDIAGKTVEQYHSGVTDPPMTLPANAWYRMIKLFNSYVDPFDKNDKMHLVSFNASQDLWWFAHWVYDHVNHKFFYSYFHRWPLCLWHKAMWDLSVQENRPEEFNLEGVCRHLGIPWDHDKAHTAPYDRDKARELYYKLEEPSYG